MSGYSWPTPAAKPGHVGQLYHAPEVGELLFRTTPTGPEDAWSGRWNQESLSAGLHEVYGSDRNLRLWLDRKGFMCWPSNRPEKLWV